MTKALFPPSDYSRCEWEFNFICHILSLMKVRSRCASFSPFIDMDPPKIKCPNLKDKWAEPGKLTAKVTWDTPEGVDTADGILTESVSPPPPFEAHTLWFLSATRLWTGESLQGIKADYSLFQCHSQRETFQIKLPRGAAQAVLHSVWPSGEQRILPLHCQGARWAFSTCPTGQTALIMCTSSKHFTTKGVEANTR